MYYLREKNGITLISLVITIVVLLILAGVSIATLTGPNGLITKADYAKLKTEVAQMQEELELFKTGKVSENTGFIEDTLNADKEKVSYNTKNDSTENNINDILTSLDKWKYKENIEISKGELTFVSQDLKLIEMAKSLGLSINPYEIIDGELQSSETNLELMDSTGTLTLPSSVTKIGEGAFSNVEGLKTIIIPGTCKIIGKNAFANNKTLEKVIMKDGVEITGERAFRNCINLSTVEMADSITQIDREAFSMCTNLQSVNISKRLKQINSYVFYSCGLKEIIIPNGVINIGSSTFQNCKQLQKVIIPETVKTIEGTAFANCTSLKNIEIDEKNKNFIFEKGILMDSKKENMIVILYSAISGNVFTVPEGVLRLVNGQLSLYPQITTINIPSSVITIDPGFIGTEITQVNIDIGNTKYETYQNAVYEKNNDVREKLIRYYGTEENVKVEDGIKAIGSYAFHLKKINNISLPNSLESLETQSLGSTNLTSLSLGDNVKLIDSLFIYNSKITKLTISETNPNYVVENNILYNKDRKQGIKELILPIYPIGTIETFEIPYGVTRIGGQAFHNQNNMTNIMIPETVTEIENAFNYCTSLTKIEIPSSVMKIFPNCFENSPNINEMIIHKEKGSIEGSPWGIEKGERAIKWIK